MLSAEADLVLSPTPPASDILESFVSDATFGLRVNRGNGQTRANAGQSFEHETAFQISAVTFRIWPNQSGGDVSFSGGADTIQLLIHEDTTANGTPNNVVYSEMFNAQGFTFTRGSYLTFDLATPTPLLQADTQYGAILAWTSDEPDHFFQIERNNGGNLYADGGRLFGTNASLTPAPNGVQDATFYIQGSVIPEPSSAALVSMAGVCLIILRRRLQAS